MLRVSHRKLCFGYKNKERTDNFNLWFDSKPLTVTFTFYHVYFKWLKALKYICLTPFTLYTLIHIYYIIKWLKVKSFK